MGFEESKHKRGQPKNSGQFSSNPSSGTKEVNYSDHKEVQYKPGMKPPGERNGQVQSDTSTPSKSQPSSPGGTQGVLNVPKPTKPPSGKAPWNMTPQEMKDEGIMFFRTGQGSLYVRNQQGQTIRVKSLHTGHDQKDTGLKRGSEITYYMDSEAAKNVGMWQTSSAKNKRLVIKDGWLFLTSANAATGKQGIDGQPMKLSDVPARGASPLELNDKSSQDIVPGSVAWKGSHPGSPITDEVSIEDGHKELMAAARAAGKVTTKAIMNDYYANGGTALAPIPESMIPPSPERWATVKWSEIESLLIGVRQQSYIEGWNDGKVMGYRIALEELHTKAHKSIVSHDDAVIVKGRDKYVFHGEDCPKCKASMEGDSYTGKCNSCGHKWGKKRRKKGKHCYVRAFDPDQPRDKEGKWSKTRSALRGEKIVEKLSKTRGGRAVLSTGKKGYKIFHAIEKRAMYVAKKVQRLGVLAAKERGLDEDGQKRLTKMLYAADFLGGYATGAAAMAVRAPIPVVKASMLMPSASVFYLAYSTVRNPRATWKAAKALALEMKEKGDDHEIDINLDTNDLEWEQDDAHIVRARKDDILDTLTDSNARKLADALVKCDDPDWFEACFVAFLGAGTGFDRALDLSLRAQKRTERKAFKEEDHPRDEKGRWTSTGSRAKGQVWSSFGVYGNVRFEEDESGKVYGEHGEDAVVVNPHLGSGKPKGLNFPAADDVTETHHLAAHELVHKVYSEDAELGQEMSKRLQAVKAEYGSAVSMYGAFEGAFENLIELGAAYAHSPEQLKTYSKEMYDIADEWAKRVRQKVEAKAFPDSHILSPQEEKVADLASWLTSDDLYVKGKKFDESKVKRAPKGTEKGGEFVGKEYASKTEMKHWNAIYKQRIKDAIVPDEEKVKKSRADMEKRNKAKRAMTELKAKLKEAKGKKAEKLRSKLAVMKTNAGRAGGDKRGSSEDRRKRRIFLWEEYGGEEYGYVVCACGLKVHKDEDNDAGYERFEAGKVFTDYQGGSYSRDNVIPECFGCNRSRNDKTVREENT